MRARYRYGFTRVNGIDSIHEFCSIRGGGGGEEGDETNERSASFRFRAHATVTFAPVPVNFRQAARCPNTRLPTSIISKINFELI
jgi:hypothetical protein